MNIEANKFGGLEKAWRNIKAKTVTIYIFQEVRTCDVFVEKFMNRDSIYGELLGEVSRSKQRHN